MAAEQPRLRDFGDELVTAKDLIEMLTKLEAKLEAAIAETRARQSALHWAPQPRAAVASAADEPVSRQSERVD